MSDADQAAASARHLKAFSGRAQRRTVSAETLAPLQCQPLSAAPYAPWVITPNTLGFDLLRYLEEQREQWQAWYYQYGALLFRGFQLDHVAAVAAVAQRVMSDLFKENTEHQPISADGLVQVPVDYAKDQFLLWHNENTFNNRWPQQAIFACAVPAASGGETPIVDSRLIYQDLDAEIRQAFVEKQVMYVRKYGTHDHLGLSWKTIFNSANKAEVEQACIAQKMSFEWLPGDELLTRAVRPAVWRHPVNGAWCWVNQAQHFHFSCLSEATQTALKKLYPDERQYPRNCYFGDGSPIPDPYMQRILALYRQHQLSFPWQQGDLMLVDNILKAHARNPFQGDRRIMVCFGGMECFDPN